MTPDQIRKRLMALEDYRWSVMRNDWDTPERVDLELMKISRAETELRERLKATGEQP